MRGCVNWWLARKMLVKFQSFPSLFQFPVLPQFDRLCDGGPAGCPWLGVLLEGLSSQLQLSLLALGTFLPCDCSMLLPRLPRHKLDEEYFLPLCLFGLGFFNPDKWLD